MPLRVSELQTLTADVSGGCPGAPDLEPGVSRALRSAEHRSLLPITHTPALPRHCQSADPQQLPAAADEQVHAGRLGSRCGGVCEGE